MKSSAELRSTAPARYGGSRIKPTPKPANQLKALCSPSQMTVTSRGRLHTPVTATGLPSTRSFSSSRSRSPTAEVAGVPSETAGKHWRNVTAAVFEYLAIAAPVPRWEDVVAGRLKPNQPTMRCRLLNELLGNGGQAVVMKGVDLNTGRVFAMKEFHKKEKAEDASVLCLESFAREVNALRELDHPNVVRLLGIGVCKDYARILLEHASEGSVNDMIKNIGPFSENMMIIYIVQAVRGLAYLHKMGVIHCDIKSRNLLVTANGVVKVADFGVCRMASGSGSSTSCHGTVWWMSPEAARGANPSETRDIWALGCVVIEMITGELPWNSLGLDWLQACYFLRVCTTSPPLEPGYPLAAETITFFNACTQVDPKSRPTANELLKHAMFSRLIPSPDAPSGYIFQDSPGPAA